MILKSNERGFTLIEVLMALSIMSIIMISFSSIILNSTRVYKEEILKREEVQKSILFDRWLKNRLKNASSAYISNKDGKFTLKEQDSNNLFKIVLYQSKDQPAVGIEKYQFDNNILRYIKKEPILNGIVNLEIKKIRNDINNKKTFNFSLKFYDSNNRYQFVLY